MDHAQHARATAAKRRQSADGLDALLGDLTRLFDLLRDVLSAY